MGAIIEQSLQFSSYAIMTGNLGLQNVSSTMQKANGAIMGSFERFADDKFPITAGTVPMTPIQSANNDRFVTYGRNAIKTTASSIGRLMYRGFNQLDDNIDFKMLDTGLWQLPQNFSIYWAYGEWAYGIDKDRGVHYPGSLVACLTGPTNQTELDGVKYLLRKNKNILYLELNLNDDFSDDIIDFSGFSSESLISIQIECHKIDNVLKIRGLNNMHFPRLAMLYLNTGGAEYTKNVPIMRCPSHFTNLQYLMFNGWGAIYGDDYDLLPLKKLKWLYIADYDSANEHSDDADHLHVSSSVIPFLPSLEKFHILTMMPTKASTWNNMYDSNIETQMQNFLDIELNNKYYGFNRWRYGDNCQIGLYWYKQNSASETEISINATRDA